MLRIALTLIVFLLGPANTGAQTDNDEPLFPVDHEGKTIYIDRTGKVVLTVPYRAGRFSEGLARYNVDGKVGYIDRTGRTVIEPQAISSLDFSQGLARFYVGPPCKGADDPSYFGFIDRAGKVAIAPKLSHPCNYYGDQFDFKKEGLVLTQVGNKWGFADRTGKIVMEFDEARHFSEGLAPVRINGKYGFVDPTGRIVLPPKFEAALPFSEGLAAVRLNGKSGFIDKTGNIVIPIQFEQAVSFSDGMAPVEVAGKWGYIGRDGKIAVKPGNVYTYAKPFSNGRAITEIDREAGYIDRTGRVVIEPQFHWAENFRDGLALVIDAESGHRAYIDTQGKIVYAFPQPKEPPPNLNNPFVRISLSSDVAWLESIAGSSTAALELKPGGGLAGHSKDLRTAAYSRLGDLGTAESLAAVRRIEERARQTALMVPKYVPLDVAIHPGWHFSDSEMRPIAQVTSNKGIAYGVIVGSSMGDLDLFLISNETPGNAATWTRPKLILNRVYRGLREPKLTLEGNDLLILHFSQDPPPKRALMEGTHDPGPSSSKLGPQQMRLSIRAIEKDSDGDGWTDIEEERLGLNPKNRDSDGDGVADGKDGCPNYMSSAADADDEDVKIIQRAVFATFGLSGSRHLLLVQPESRRLDVWGYRGPVIYGHEVKSWTSRHQYGGVFVNWKIRKRSDTQVIVEIVDYEGPLAAGGQDVRLRRIEGEWFVVSRRTTWVS